MEGEEARTGGLTGTPRVRASIQTCTRTLRQMVSESDRRLNRAAGIGAFVGLVIGLTFSVLAATRLGMGLLVAYGMPLGTGLGLAAGALFGLWREERAKGRCRGCGYPAEGLPHNTCPECGRPFVG